MQPDQSQRLVYSIYSTCSVRELCLTIAAILKLSNAWLYLSTTCKVIIWVVIATATYVATMVTM